MTTIQMLYNWSINFIKSSSTLTGILNNQVWNGFSILGLVTIGGLMAYLSVAIIKWLLS